MHWYNDCYLSIGGGANATGELTDGHDTFSVGDIDLTFAVGHSIIYLDHDNEVNTDISVCGVPRNRGFRNSITGLYLPAPDLVFCLGGEDLPAYWMKDEQGSLHHDMIKAKDLPSRKLRMPVTEPADKELSTEDKFADLTARSELEPRARNYYLRCDPGGIGLAQCTAFHDTYCDNGGGLHSDNLYCQHDCHCLPIPQRSRCGLHYDFIYDCYHYDAEEKADVVFDTSESEEDNPEQEEDE